MIHEKPVGPNKERPRTVIDGEVTNQGDPTFESLSTREKHDARMEGEAGWDALCAFYAKRCEVSSGDAIPWTFETCPWPLTIIRPVLSNEVCLALSKCAGGVVIALFGYPTTIHSISYEELFMEWLQIDGQKCETKKQ